MPEIMCFMLGGHHQRIGHSRLPLFTLGNAHRSQPWQSANTCRPI